MSIDYQVGSHQRGDISEKTFIRNTLGNAILKGMKTSGRSLLEFNFKSSNVNTGEFSTKVKIQSSDDTQIHRKEIKIRKPPRKRESTVVSTTNLKKFKEEGKKMINQYSVEKTLGKGSFATVLLCSDSQTGTKYAIKQMNKKTLSKKKCGPGMNALDCVIEELKVLKSLEHPNIIWLHEIIDDPKKDSIYLVQEWYTKGSLGD